MASVFFKILNCKTTRRDSRGSEGNKVESVAGLAGKSVNNAIFLQGIGSDDSRTSYSARYPVVFIQFANKKTFEKVYQYMLNTTNSYKKPE